MCRLTVGRTEIVQDVRIKLAQKFAHTYECNSTLTSHRP